jgi:hypothetical protein
MKKQLTILLAFLLCFQFSKAQSVTTHTYRFVKQSDMQEYIKRETTYWAKVADDAMKKGNLTFWALLVKQGGENMGHSPNILLINSYTNIDSIGSVWNSISDIFPNEKMEDMETGSLSKNAANIFLRDLGNHTEIENVDPDKDFNVVHIIYHNNKDNAKHLAFESEKWKPMIEKAMKEGKTTMKGWGNGIIVSPESPKFPYSSYSYDLFASAQAALLPAFSDDFEFPEGFFTDNADNYAGPRSSHLYRIMKVVSAPPPAE